MVDEKTFSDLHGYYFEDLQVGMTAVHGKTVTDADVLMFTGVSGDTNPLHLNRDFAGGTPFGEPIVHGMLTASLISTLIGTRLPGPGCIYMDQSLKFTAPVRVGDTVIARATIQEMDRERPYVIMETTCEVDGEIVLKGKAKIKVPRRSNGNNLPRSTKVQNGSS